MLVDRGGPFADPFGARAALRGGNGWAALEPGVGHGSTIAVPPDRLRASSRKIAAVQGRGRVRKGGSGGQVRPMTPGCPGCGDVSDRPASSSPPRTVAGRGKVAGGM